MQGLDTRPPASKGRIPARQTPDSPISALPSCGTPVGGSFALLGGDGLMAAAFGLLGRLADPRLAGCLMRIGRAADDVVAGQWLDEPATWAGVAAELREVHWLRMCRGKLALGNAWGPLGAFWTGHGELETDIVELLAEFSIVSQIINDFGDWFGRAGYHELVRDSRPPRQEARRKPTLPLIWAARCDVAEPEHLLGPARTEIERRKAAALAALDRFSLDPVRRELLLDFFASPRLPEPGEVIG